MIKRLRERKGLTQSELAKKIGLNKTSVSYMERKVKGHRASYSTIKLLAEELEECPLKIFLFFANIECKHIKLDTNLNVNTKCAFENCINNDLENAFRSKELIGLREIRRLRFENKMLKKQLKLSMRIKNNASYSYTKRAARLRN